MMSIQNENFNKYGIKNQLLNLNKIYAPLQLFSLTEGIYQISIKNREDESSSINGSLFMHIRMYQKVQ